jgi:hypothetical protein
MTGFGKLMPPYQRREQLRERFPGWEIWNQRQEGLGIGEITWYARREGVHLKPFAAPKADQLAEYIDSAVAADTSKQAQVFGHEPPAD